MAQQLLQQWDQLSVHDGVLIREIEDDDERMVLTQLVVPKQCRQEVLRHLHNGQWGAHLGENKTLKKLRMRYYWPGYAADVKEWCRSCEFCAQRKMPNPKPRAPLVSVQAGYPM